MASPILVTGGTGTLGRHVVARLLDAGQHVRVLSRRPQAPQPGVEFVVGDLMMGTGVTAAVDGVATVVHCASDNKGDVAATRALTAASARAGVTHLVYVSIVGIERLSFGYTKAKLDCERVVADSGVPWTTIRATQFYDMIFKGVRKLGVLPVAPVPAGFVLQPVDSDEVAAILVRLALAAPAGRVPDFAGPQVLSFTDLQRTYGVAIGRSRPVVSVWLPGLSKIRAGALLPADRETQRGTRTWADFLKDQLRDSRTVSRRRLQP
jgi:uncharacterized protein YbjT (DUF2867 family)